MKFYNLYEAWKARKLALEKGAFRNNLRRWEHYWFEADEEFVEACLDAGIKVGKTLDYIFPFLQSINSKQEFHEFLTDIVEIKQFFIDKGFDEESAEYWLILFLKNSEVAELLQSKGIYDKKILEKLIDMPYISSRNMKNLFELYEKYLPDSEKILQEFKYLIKEDWISDNEFMQNSFMEHRFKEANEKGFKSLIFWYVLSKNIYSIKLYNAKRRKNFYLSLGLDDITSEWWVAHELMIGAGDSPIVLDKEHKDGILAVNDLLHISEIFKAIEKEIRDGIRDPLEQKNFLKIVKWTKEGVGDYRNIEGLDLKTAKKWASLGVNSEYVQEISDRISPEEFQSLLEDSHSTADELANWLVYLDKEQIKDWFKLGIKDFRLYKALALNNSLSYQQIETFLKYLSLDELVKVFTEKGIKGVEETYNQKSSYKIVLKQFRRRN